MEHSVALNLDYQYYPNLDRLIFEDGVCYTTEEAVILAQISSRASEDLKAVHLVKKVFGGEVLRKGEGMSIAEQDRSWFELITPCREPDPTPVTRAGLKPARTRKGKLQDTPIDAEIMSFL
jgi:hypothetical protein